MDPTSFEKLGAFFLGRRLEEERRPLDEAVVMEARDLVTHGVCLGMLGSGKTGLCIALLEEAALDGVPAIVVDPKGHLANLCLAFPTMNAADLAPSAALDTALSVGSTVLGALFGRKALSQTNLRRASSSARKASKAAEARGDVTSAREEMERTQEQAAELVAELEEAQRAIEARVPALEVLEVRAKASGVDVQELWLLWSHPA